MKFIHVMFAILLLALSACAKDPVVAELQAFDKLGKTVFQDANFNGLNQRMREAKTNEDKAALLDDVIKMMDGRSKDMAAFQAKTPEVSKISETFNKGIQLSLDGAKHAKTALLASDQPALNAAAAELVSGQKTIMESANSIVKLAKERKIDLNK